LRKIICQKVMLSLCSLRKQSGSLKVIQLLQSWKRSQGSASKADEVFQGSIDELLSPNLCQTHPVITVTMLSFSESNACFVEQKLNRFSYLRGRVPTACEHDPIEDWRVGNWLFIGWGNRFPSAILQVEIGRLSSSCIKQTDGTLQTPHSGVIPTGASAGRAILW
jgi:hypothetical protein